MNSLSASLLLTIFATSAAGDEKETDIKTASEQFAVRTLKLIDLIHQDHAFPGEKAHMVRWAVEGIFGGVNEPIPMHLKKRLDDLEFLDGNARRILLQDARAWLGVRKKLTAEHGLELALRGIFTRLESGGSAAERSSYTPAEKIGRIICNMDNPYGVGLKLESDPVSGFIRVTTPVLHSPAHKAGIRAGDLITHIRVEKKIGGNARLETISTAGLTAEQAAQLILGPEGTPVGLVVRRPT